jgi:hypothetical protein
VRQDPKNGVFFAEGTPADLLGLCPLLVPVDDAHYQPSAHLRTSYAMSVDESLFPLVRVIVCSAVGDRGVVCAEDLVCVDVRVVRAESCPACVCCVLCVVCW